MTLHYLDHVVKPVLLGSSIIHTCRSARDYGLKWSSSSKCFTHSKTIFSSQLSLKVDIEVCEALYVSRVNPGELIQLSH